MHTEQARIGPSEGQKKDGTPSGAPLESTPMSTRQGRINWLSQWLIENPGNGSNLTGATVQSMYHQSGVELSLRQARADLALARNQVATAAYGLDLPHWSEDVSGASMRNAVADVLKSDQYATIEQIRQHVAREFHRFITEDEVRTIARRIYEALYIMPKVEAAEAVLREAHGYTWTADKARYEANPLNHPNPYGTDPNRVRASVLAVTWKLVNDLAGRPDRRINRHDGREMLKALKMIVDVADAMDDESAEPAAVIRRVEEIQLPN